MAIHKISFNISIPNTTSSTGSTAIDRESKNLQNQLTSKQQRLKQLSSDSEMSAEEKAKERQELQQQIAELNRKLRMEHMEQTEEEKKATKEQKEKALQKKELLEEVTSKPQKETESAEKESMKMPDSVLSVQDMQRMFATDSLLQQDRVRASIDRKKEGRADVLEAEIALDSLYGSDTEAKREEVSGLRRQGAFQEEIQKIGEKQESDAAKTIPKIIIREK